MPKAAEYEYLLRFSEPSAPSTWYYIGSTHGRSTSSGDTPASTYVPPALATLPTFQIVGFDGMDPVSSARSSIGSVVLRDPTGVLDTYYDYVLDGGIMELRRGTPGANLSTFSTVATWTPGGMSYGTNTKEIRAHNLARILETAPLHDERFSGEGGGGGDATLTGILKPYCVGQVYRVPAVLMNEATLIYMVSCTSVEAIDGVAEGGASLTFSGNDRADYAALAAATITPGYYDTCLALGLFRLGASSLWDITADVRGDNSGSGYVDARGDIAKRIVTRAGTALTAGQVDITALDTLEGLVPQVCGFYWGSEITKADALTEVLQGRLGYWFVNLSGVLVMRSLENSSSGGLAGTFAYGSETGEPQMAESIRPVRWKTSISWQRNYFPQNRSRLAGIVPDSLIALYTQEAQWASSADAGIYADYPTAVEKRVLSGLWDPDEAAAEAIVHQAVLLPTRERWRVPIYTDPFTLAGNIGEELRISGYSRYSWGNPRTFTLIGVEWGPDLIPIATLWG